jgi:hypothetical protein
MEMENLNKYRSETCGQYIRFPEKKLAIIFLFNGIYLPQTHQTDSGAYSPEIIRYLLEKQVVGSTMVEAPGGLFGALRARLGEFKILDFLQI